MCATENKKFKTKAEAKRKSVTFIYIQIYESDTRYKTLSYTIRLSVTIKEYKEVPLSLSLFQRPYSLLEAVSDPKCMMSAKIESALAD